MKKCTHCHKVKPIHLFYESKVSGDGHHSWCIDCVKAKSVGRHSDVSRPLAVSTAYAREYLKKRHIPCCVGKAMGYRGIDLMAWACVPIEAKLSAEFGPNKFIWTFTRGQFARLTGFLLLIADFGNRQRVFIVPVSRFLHSRKTGSARVGSICVTLDSDHSNSHWDMIKDCEDDTSLIEAARLDW